MMCGGLYTQPQYSVPSYTPNHIRLFLFLNGVQEINVQNHETKKTSHSKLGIFLFQLNFCWGGNFILKKAKHLAKMKLDRLNHKLVAEQEKKTKWEKNMKKLSGSIMTTSSNVVVKFSSYH